MENEPYSLFTDEPESPTTMGLLSFLDSELEGAMQELSENAAAGQDDFPAILLKRCSSALAPPLASIWRQSLRDGIVPSTCKLAHIIPIHKGKSWSLPYNYRTVALTSHLIKVFEKVVCRCLVDFMNTHR